MSFIDTPQESLYGAFNAVKASLEMRLGLQALNERRIARGEIPIKIGMGLHFGDAISGTVGSEALMEFTVIGDTVNLASRIEASTKAFGTDLLISEDLAKKIEGRVVIELAGSAEVKGKTEPLKFFKVRGFMNPDGSQQILKTDYSDYEAGDVEKVKVTQSGAVKLAAPKNESRFAARVSKEDFENFKSISEKKGIGYQTLLGSIIHLYVIGQLVDVDEIKKVSPQIKIKL